MNFRRAAHIAAMLGVGASILVLPVTAMGACANGTRYHTAFAVPEPAWDSMGQTISEGMLTLRAAAGSHVSAMLQSFSFTDASICATLSTGASGMPNGQAGIVYFLRGSGKAVRYSTFTIDASRSFYVYTVDNGTRTQDLVVHDAPDVAVAPGAKNDLLVVAHGTHVAFSINGAQVAALDDDSGGTPSWHAGLYVAAPPSGAAQWTFTSFDVGNSARLLPQCATTTSP